jgi:hypothetical protein
MNRTKDRRKSTSELFESPLGMIRLPHATGLLICIIELCNDHSTGLLICTIEPCNDHATGILIYTIEPCNDQATSHYRTFNLYHWTVQWDQCATKFNICGLSNTDPHLGQTYTHRDACMHTCAYRHTHTRTHLLASRVKSRRMWSSQNLASTAISLARAIKADSPMMGWACSPHILARCYFKPHILARYCFRYHEMVMTEENGRAHFMPAVIQYTWLGLARTIY